MPEKMSVDKQQALRTMGAEVVITDNVPPGDPRHFQQVAQRIAAQRPGCFWTDQFGNAANPEVHARTTANELWAQSDGKISAFVTGVGTGGTITGVGRALKALNPKIQIVLADPKGSRLAGLINDGELGEDGSYLVEGVGSSQVPGLDPSVVDFAVQVSDREGLNDPPLGEEEVSLGSSGFSAAAALKRCHSCQHAMLMDWWWRCCRFLGSLVQAFNPSWMAAELG